MAMITLANKINRDIPNFYVKLAHEKIGELSGRKILIIGLSYKVNLADVRETPVSSLIEKLRAKGAKVFWHDELVKEWNGEASVSISGGFDLAIVTTPHDGIDLSILGTTPIINTRGSV